MQSKATTVAQYLAELPEDRRKALQAVREVILKNIDPVYKECMDYGMMGWAVPHSVFPDGYHCDPKQPLPFAGLASQKGHMSFYIMADCHCTNKGPEPSPEGEWFRKEVAKRGMKLDMGKSCIRFKKLEQLPLDLIGELIRKLPAKLFIERYVAVRDWNAANPGKVRPKAAKTSKKKVSSSTSTRGAQAKGVTNGKAASSRSAPRR